KPRCLAARRHRYRKAPARCYEATGSGPGSCTAMTPLADILDLARWAPSGDNTQPWRFAIEAEDHVAVHGHDTRTYCVYDLDGHPSQISLGALLETVALAATRFGLATEIKRRRDSPDDRPIFDVWFREEADRGQDPLVSQIRER